MPLNMPLLQEKQIAAECGLGYSVACLLNVSFSSRISTNVTWCAPPSLVIVIVPMSACLVTMSKICRTVHNTTVKPVIIQVQQLLQHRHVCLQCQHDVYSRKNY